MVQIALNYYSKIDQSKIDLTKMSETNCNWFFEEPQWPENLTYMLSKQFSDQELTSTNETQILEQIRQDFLPIKNLLKNYIDQSQQQVKNIEKKKKISNTTNLKNKKNKKAQRMSPLIQQIEVINVEQIPQKNDYKTNRKNSQTVFSDQIQQKNEHIQLLNIQTCVTFNDYSQEVQISKNISMKGKKHQPLKRLGRQPIDREMEQKIVDYVQNLIKAQKTFTTTQIRKKAKTLSKNPDFKASKGWYQRFRKRNSHIFQKL